MADDLHVPGFIDQPASIVKRLPPMEQAIFRLNATDDLSYAEISRRLGIDIPAIMEFLTEALILLDAIRCGEEPQRTASPIRQRADASLRARYRIYSENRLRERGFATPISWRPDEDEDRTVSRVIFESLSPTDLETFLLNRVDGLSYVEIAKAMGTFQWMVRRRMARVIAVICRGYCSFYDWLIALGRNPEA